jgi:hypothetical protein
MARLNQEVRAVQNPALGAAVLWRSVVGYEQGNRKGAPTPLPILFLLLPILLHDETARVVASTNRGSGLRKFEEKFFGTQAKADLVFAIHTRALAMRGLTLDSLRVSLAGGLLSIDPVSASAFALSKTPAAAGIAESVRELLRSAEKLGYWLGELTLHEIGIILRVSF